jgi:chromosomal replication initiation ATPase DnaA
LARGDGGKDPGSSVAENEANDLEIAKALGEGNVAVEEEHKLSSPIRFIRCIRWNVAAQQEQRQEVIAEVEAGDELGACGTHAAEEQAEPPQATSSADADVGHYVRTCGTDAPQEAADESAYASKRQHTPANVSSIHQQTSAAEEAHICKAAPRTTSSSGLNAEQLLPGQHQHPAAPAGSTDQQQLQHRPAEQLQHRPAEQLQHRPAEQQQPAQTSSNSSGLNAEQQQAAQHPAREPLMILAGAGSGKTKTLISRMQHLKDEGIPLSKILVLTFSTAATKELTSRVAKAFRG